MIIIGLVIINTIVYALWKGCTTSKKLNFMINHFTFHPYQFILKRYYTIFTYSISHMTFSHLFINNLGLLFCLPVEEKFGSLIVLGLFLWGALIGSLTHLIYKFCFPTKYLLWQCDQIITGSSGGVMAIFVLSQINMTAYYFKIITLILDVSLIIYPINSKISHSGHVASVLSTLCLVYLFM